MSTPIHPRPADLVAERDALRFEIRLSWDGTDPWGGCLSALGAVCDVLWFTDNEDRIPDDAEYRPSPLWSRDGSTPFSPVEDYPASMILELLDDEHTSIDALAYWARVLSRFADLVPESARY